jgi:ABC-type multidrug transport system permease subunit
MDLLKNRFVQSLGVGAFFYLLMLSVNWVMLFTLRILESFSGWYRYRAAPYSFQISLGVTLAYLLITAVISSRED